MPADRRRKQKANRRWEVEVVHQEAGARQEDEWWRQCYNQQKGNTERMINGGNATTIQKRGTGGPCAMRGNGAMGGGDAGRWEATG